MTQAIKTMDAERNGCIEIDEMIRWLAAPSSPSPPPGINDADEVLWSERAQEELAKFLPKPRTPPVGTRLSKPRVRQPARRLASLHLDAPPSPQSLITSVDPSARHLRLTTSVRRRRVPEVASVASFAFSPSGSATQLPALPDASLGSQTLTDAAGLSTGASGGGWALTASSASLLSTSSSLPSLARRAHKPAAPAFAASVSKLRLPLEAGVSWRSPHAPSWSPTPGMEAKSQEARLLRHTRAERAKLLSSMKSFAASLPRVPRTVARAPTLSTSQVGLYKEWPKGLVGHAGLRTTDPGSPTHSLRWDPTRSSKASLIAPIASLPACRGF